MKKDDIITLRLPSETVKRIDDLVAHGDYKNRAEFLEIAINDRFGVPSKREIVESNLDDVTQKLNEYMSTLLLIAKKKGSVEMSADELSVLESLETGKNPAL